MHHLKMITFYFSCMWFHNWTSEPVVSNRGRVNQLHFHWLQSRDFLNGMKSVQNIDWAISSFKIFDWNKKWSTERHLTSKFMISSSIAMYCSSVLSTFLTSTYYSIVAGSALPNSNWAALSGLSAYVNIRTGGIDKIWKWWPFHYLCDALTYRRDDALLIELVTNQ
jgi:hypothetical protein